MKIMAGLLRQGRWADEIVKLNARKDGEVTASSPSSGD
jgi:hypothetical protein